MTVIRFSRVPLWTATMRLPNIISLSADTADAQTKGNSAS